MKSNVICISAALTAALFVVAPAGAQQQYNFNFVANGGLYDVSGTFTVSNVLDGAGGYDITGITGLVASGGGGITGLVGTTVAPPAYSFWSWSGSTGFNYDNVLFPSQPFSLDNYGVLFSTGANVWNLYSSPAGNPNTFELYSFSGGAGGSAVDVIGAMSLAAVPEPETYALMMAGMIALGVVSRRRRLHQQ